MSPLVDAAPPPAAQPLYELAPASAWPAATPATPSTSTCSARWCSTPGCAGAAGGSSANLPADGSPRTRSRSCGPGRGVGRRRGPGRRWRQQRLDALSQRIGQESVHKAGHGWEHPRDEPPGLSSRPTAVPECPLRPGQLLSQDPAVTPAVSRLSANQVTWSRERWSVVRIKDLEGRMTASLGRALGQL